MQAVHFNGLQPLHKRLHRDKQRSLCRYFQSAVIRGPRVSCQCSALIFLFPVLKYWGGTAVAQLLRCRATNRKVASSIPAGFSGFFIDIKSFRSHYGPGADSASNRNE